MQRLIWHTVKDSNPIREFWRLTVRHTTTI